MSKSQFPSSTDRAAIAERAYYKWADAGCPQGDGSEFWFAAEQELTKADVTLEEVTESIGLGDAVGTAAFIAAHASAKKAIEEIIELELVQ